ncbi:hypothetical protein [Quadrisphaera sp. DSM 44207]|uniref:hypothetical protein n=1 Tax=Quadrisphaera sp. DSM 44207 TaxID=1881057 RepID=UPI0008863F9A|nr:hypothetical protein [Quadrisphaera sp. DSM 44207]SDQ52788.1 hypothetical protein SAMN05428996_2053 [Quadrisphaera sp. DSM 44207]
MALTLLAVAVGGVLLGGALSLRGQRAPLPLVLLVAVLALGCFVLAAMIAP